MPRSPSVPLLPLCLLLAACGAKSSLSDGEGGSAAAGVGGTGAGGAGGTTTGGAGGTAVTACGALIVDGPPLSPAPAFAGDELLVPWLARSETDGSRAAFVYMERESELDVFFLSASVALDDPWGVWPADLGTSGWHGQTDGFVVGPASEGRFSMLTTDEPNNAGDVPTGMVIWRPTAGVPGAVGQFFDDVPPGRPLLVTSNGDDHLGGFQRQLGGGLQHLTLARVKPGGGPVSSNAVAACALDAGLSGGAIPLGAGYLVALSSGRPFAKCLTDDLADGPPTRLQIVSMPGAPAEASLTFELDEPTFYVFQTHLTPAEGGAWAAWERIPFEPPFERRIQLVQLDAAGLPVNGKVIETGTGTVGAPVALTALGPRPVLATMVEEAGGPRSLAVRLLAEDGALVTEVKLTADAGFEMDSSVTLLASPAGDRLLVAWSESSAIGNDTRRVRVARLTCAGP